MTPRGKLPGVPSSAPQDGASALRCWVQLHGSSRPCIKVSLSSLNGNASRDTADTTRKRTNVGGSYIQMSAMVLGSMLEADHRLREYEARIRMQRRLMRDRAKWERFEQEFLENPEEKK